MLCPTSRSQHQKCLWAGFSRSVNISMCHKSYALDAVSYFLSYWLMLCSISWFSVTEGQSFTEKLQENLAKVP